MRGWGRGQTSFQHPVVREIWQTKSEKMFEIVLNSLNFCSCSHDRIETSRGTSHKRITCHFHTHFKEFQSIFKKCVRIFLIGNLISYIFWSEFFSLSRIGTKLGKVIGKKPRFWGILGNVEGEARVWICVNLNMLLRGRRS